MELINLAFLLEDRECTGVDLTEMSQIGFHF